MNSSTQNNPPSFSIITPTLNQGKFIKKTIQSVLSQNYENFEYLIFDGGSNDETLSILESFGDSIHWVSEPDRGQAHAINKGIKNAKGEVIGWLNSDDIYYPGTLSKVYEFFKKNPGIKILYAMADHIDENDKVIESYYTEGWNYKKLFKVCYICQPAVFFRRSIIEKFGFLDESLNYCMDYEYWLRVGSKVPFYYLKQKLAGSRLHKETKTLDSAVPFHQEILKMFKTRFRKIPSRWLFNFAHSVARESNLKRNSPEENLKFVKKIITVSICTSLRMRYYIPLGEIKTLLGWYISAKKQARANLDENRL